MAEYHLAQLNIAKFRASAYDPVNQDFHDAINSVNAVAESDPGFVWRLVDDAPERRIHNVFQDPKLLVNLSVWQDTERLSQFVYRTPIHRDIMRRRSEDPVQRPLHLSTYLLRLKRQVPHLGLHGRALGQSRAHSAETFY